jgi:hypothetical protein
MFGWHPTLTAPESKSQNTNEDKKPQKQVKASKSKRRRIRKSKARREFEANMKDLENCLDNLQIESKKILKDNQRHTFLSNIKAMRQSKFNSHRALILDKESEEDNKNNMLSMR